MARLTILTFVLLLTTAATALAQQPSAEEVMQRLRAQFEEAVAWRANFRQVLDTDFSDSSNIVAGTIVLAGDKYRIETADQTVVTDGDTTWVYLIDDNQVIINEQIDEDEAFTPTHFLDERAEKYDVAYADGQSPTEYVVNLSATSPDTYLESATLWISKDSWTISRIDVVDVNGASIRFEMSEVDLAADVTDSTFTFVPTEGVEIIDLR